MTIIVTDYDKSDDSEALQVDEQTTLTVLHMRSNDSVIQDTSV